MEYSPGSLLDTVKLGSSWLGSEGLELLSLDRVVRVSLSVINLALQTATEVVVGWLELGLLGNHSVPVLFAVGLELA